MRKLRAPLLALPMLAATPPPPSENSQLIAAAAEAAAVCGISAGSAGVETKSFDTSDGEWLPVAEPLGYRHRDLPVTVALLPDDKGVVRLCRAQAKMESQKDQATLALALEVLLRQKPANHDGGVLWRFGKSPNGRSLHMVRDMVSPQPEIRFTGAAF